MCTCVRVTVFYVVWLLRLALNEIRRLRPHSVAVIALCCSSYSVMRGSESQALGCKALLVRVPTEVETHIGQINHPARRTQWLFFCEIGQPFRGPDMPVNPLPLLQTMPVVA